LATLVKPRPEIVELNGVTLPHFARLTPECEAECVLAGFTSVTAIEECVRRSRKSWAIMLGDEVIAFWGYAPPGLWSTEADAWCLMTPLALTNRIFVARHSLVIIATLLGSFPAIRVVCDRQHAVALKWLDWLGFSAVSYNSNFVTCIAQKGFGRWA
jgi:hypothetical protein